MLTQLVDSTTGLRVHLLTPKRTVAYGRVGRTDQRLGQGKSCKQEKELLYDNLYDYMLSLT